MYDPRGYRLIVLITLGRSVGSGRCSMLIDTHVHAYAAPMPSLGEAEVTIEAVVAAMDRLAVDRAILVSAWGAYADDPRYAVEGYTKHPDRFRLVTPFDVRVADLEEKLERWSVTPGAVGMRLLGIDGHDILPESAEVRSVIRAAERSGMPVCILSPGRPEIPDRLARSSPDVRFVVDHLGLGLGLAGSAGSDPLESLGAVLQLARHDNVAIKIANVGRLSQSAPPFEDMWEPVARLIDAFGVDRCMWGSDWTVSQDVASVDELVGAFQEEWPLTRHEREMLMGVTAAEVFRWRQMDVPADSAQR